MSSIRVLGLQCQTPKVAMTKIDIVFSGFAWISTSSVVEPGSTTWAVDMLKVLPGLLNIFRGGWDLGGWWMDPPSPPPSPQVLWRRRKKLGASSPRNMSLRLMSRKKREEQGSEWAGGRFITTTKTQGGLTSGFEMCLWISFYLDIWPTHEDWNLGGKKVLTFEKYIIYNTV